MATVKQIRSKRGVRAKAKPASPSVLLRPRITEKATAKALNDHVYVFEVEQSATKHTIREAIMHFYKVKPVKIHVARTPAKTVLVRGKYGTRNAVKKAYVYLKKGDSIEFV
jgi:large subunit ribosomal protein L23